jgi:serine/threonine protein phosphatase PrpC
MTNPVSTGRKCAPEVVETTVDPQVKPEGLTDEQLRGVSFVVTTELPRASVREERTPHIHLLTIEPVTTSWAAPHDLETAPARSGECTTAAPSKVIGSQVELGSSQSQNERLTQQDRLFLAPFPPVNRETAERFLLDATEAIHDATEDTIGSGSTFTGAIITEQGDIVTAHLGDSPASYIVINARGELVDVALITKSHVPTESIAIVTAADGVRYTDMGSYRYLVHDDDTVGMGIQIIRSFGDKEFGGAISREPEISYTNLQKHLDAGHRVLLLVTSDGAHEESHPELRHDLHAVRIADLLGQDQTLQEISSDIVRSCERLGPDNISVVLVEVKRGSGAIVAVLDGHGDTADVAIQGEDILSRRAGRYRAAY